MRSYCKLLQDGRVFDYKDDDLEIGVFWIMEDLEVRLCEGVTIGSVFQLLGTYPNQFALALGCPYLAELLAEVSRPTERVLDADAIGIKRIVEVYDNEVFIGFDVGAMTVLQDGKSEWSGSVEFCRVNELLRLPLRLDTSFVIEGSFGKSDRYVGEASFTLRDVLRALVDEFTWHGSPTQRDKVAQELRKSAEKPDLVKDPDEIEEMAHLLFNTERNVEE